MKSLRTAAILFGVLVALGLIGTWDEWQTKKDDKEKAEKEKFVAIDPQAVTEFTFYDRKIHEEGDTSDKVPEGTETKVHLVKKDEHWQITSPVDAAADDAAVKAILTSIKDYKIEKVAAESKDRWKEFGLDNPRRYFELTSKGKTPEKVTVYLGIKAPVGYSVYVRSDASDKVYLGSQYLLTSTTKTLKDFRDRSIAKVEEPDVKALTYKADKQPEIDIVKADGQYKVVKPEALEADKDTVMDLISDLNSLKADDFKDKPDAKEAAAFNKAKDSTHISWTSNAGKVTKLSFAEVDKTEWASYDPQLLWFKVPDTSKSKFKKTLNDFRNHKVFAFDSSKVEEVSIDGDAFKRVDHEWYKAADAQAAQSAKDPKTKPEAKPYIQALIVDLEYAKADKFIAPHDPIAKSLKDAPQHRITLKFAETSKQAPLVIDSWDDKNDKQKSLLKHSGATFLYRVPKSVLANISPTPPKEANAASPHVPGTPEEEPGGLDSELSN